MCQEDVHTWCCCGTDRMWYVRQIVRFSKYVGVLHVQRAMLAGSLGTASHYTFQKRLLKEAVSMTLIRPIASHSMTKRWKMNGAVLSNPLSMLAFCLLVLPRTFSFVPNLAWVLPAWDGSLISREDKEYSGLGLTVAALPDLSTCMILQPPQRASRSTFFAVVVRISFSVLAEWSQTSQCFRRLGPNSLFPQAVLLPLFGVSNVDTFCNDLFVRIFGFPRVVLHLTLSVDFASKILKSHLEQSKSFAETNAFLERIFRLLVLFSTYVLALHHKDLFHVDILALDSRWGLFVLFEVPYFWKSKDSCSGISYHFVCGTCFWIAQRVPSGKVIFLWPRQMRYSVFFPK